MEDPALPQLQPGAAGVIPFRTIAFSFLAALLFVGVAAPLLAHGDKPHDAPSEHLASSDTDDEKREATRTSETVGSSMVEIANDAIADEAGGHTFITILKALHPATVHFPIALLVVAALAEMTLAWRPSHDLEAAVSVLVKFAAAGAVIAAGFGWLHTGIWLGGDNLMQLHRWTGTGLAFFTVFLAWLVPQSDTRGRGWFRLALVTAALLVLVQSYWGAEISHGPGHLFENH